MKISKHKKVICIGVDDSLISVIKLLSEKFNVSESVIIQYLIYSGIERTNNFNLDNVYKECVAFMEYSKDRKRSKKNVWRNKKENR